LYLGTINAFFHPIQTVKNIGSLVGNLITKPVRTVSGFKDQIVDCFETDTVKCLGKTTAFLGSTLGGTKLVGNANAAAKASTLGKTAESLGMTTEAVTAGAASISLSVSKYGKLAASAKSIGMSVDDLVLRASRTELSTAKYLKHQKLADSTKGVSTVEELIAAAKTDGMTVREYAKANPLTATDISLAKASDELAAADAAVKTTKSTQAAAQVSANTALKNARPIDELFAAVHPSFSETAEIALAAAKAELKAATDLAEAAVKTQTAAVKVVADLKSAAASAPIAKTGILQRSGAKMAAGARSVGNGISAGVGSAGTAIKATGVALKKSVTRPNLVRGTVGAAVAGQVSDQGETTSRHVEEVVFKSGRGGFVSA
jgi:hypothetical protein